ncbi:MAG: DNA internalization-related competence protein ComEC/Rec2 [Neisseriaceae bacterium]|nr:DNA internalization-related competence protein ComEC/Rec2 [Neisseriaceae bacterium]
MRTLIGMATALMLPLWLPEGLAIWVYVGLGVWLPLAWWRGRAEFMAVALMLVCFAYAAAWVSQTQQARVPLSLTGQVRYLTVRVQEVVSQNAGGQRLRVKVLAAETETQAPWRPNRLWLQDNSAQVWPLGSVWRLAVRLQAPLGPLNPRGYEPGLAGIWQGVDGGGRIVNGPQQWLRQQHDLSSWGASIRANRQARIDRLGEGQAAGAALVSALSLGQRQGLTPELWQLFRVTGLSHLVSISGLHVTLVGGLVAALVQFGLRYWRHPRGNSRLYTGGAGLAAAFAYAAVSGFAIPTQRSVLMLAVALLLLQARFYVSVWVVWWAAVVLVLLNHPGAALSVGFWLSFLLVGALLWVNGARRRLRPPTWARSLLRLQWTATVASLVPVAYFFGELPSVSFLVNLVAIPWATLVLIPLALLGQLLPFDAPLAWAIALADGSLTMLLRLQPWAWTWSVPALPWPLWVAAAMGTFLWLLPRGLPVQSMMWLCWLLPLAYQPEPPPQGALRVTVWDVGQGLSVLLQTRSQTILYDTGPEASAQTVLQNVQALGVRRLDALILSHDHRDHDAGWAVLAHALRPQQVWAGVPSAYASADARHCRAGGAWTVDEVYFEWLTPAMSASGNEASCVLRVIAGGQAMLLSGDLEAEGERLLVATYGDDLMSQTLILGHHGSRSSSTQPFLDRVAPKVAVVSAGFANRYGHPHAEVLRRLGQSEMAVYRTDLGGALRLDLGVGLEVRPLVPTRRWWRFKPLPQPKGGNA